MITGLIAAPFAILAILYAGGFLAQILGNYAAWKTGGGIPGDGTSPAVASPDFLPVSPALSNHRMGYMAL